MTFHIRNPAGAAGITIEKDVFDKFLWSEIGDHEVIKGFDPSKYVDGYQKFLTIPNREGVTIVDLKTGKETRKVLLFTDGAFFLSTDHQERSVPPKFGEQIVCLLSSPSTQEEVLGDLAELHANTWLPRFGNRGASIVYIWHALWLGQRLWRNAMLCAVADWFVRKIGL